MTEDEYWKKFSEMNKNRRNAIVRLVNEGVPKEKAHLNEVEERYYDSMIRQKEETEKKYGYTPTFELEELDYDDPVLDIYKD